MINVNVETAQNVVIEYPIAGVGDRILAAIVDILIVSAYGFFVLFGLAVLVSDSGAGPAFFVVFYLPVFFYHLASEVFMDGQSLGKKVMSIRVVRLDGTSPTLGNYIMRWITRLFEVGVFAGMPAIVSILVTDRGQRLGDIAAGTCVVKLRETAIAETLFQAIDPDYEMTHAEVRNLADKDVDIIKEVLRAYNKTGRTPTTARMVTQTMDVISRKMGVSTTLPPVAFLRLVVKDYNHFAGNLANDDLS